MHIMWDWDEAKRESNRRKHGVDFAEVAEFDWATALIFLDDRQDYGEDRRVALGLIGARVHHLTFTTRFGKVRVISLRRANRREQRRWTNREN